MNCKKCGAENVDGAKFCCKCGSPLDTPEKNTKINFSDINVEKILSNDKIPKQVKDIINKIKIEIETKKSEREKIYLQKRKEYNDKEFNKLLTMAIISLLGMIFITLSGC